MLFTADHTIRRQGTSTRKTIDPSRSFKFITWTGGKIKLDKLTQLQSLPRSLDIPKDRVVYFVFTSSANSMKCAHSTFVEAMLLFR